MFGFAKEIPSSVRTDDIDEAKQVKNEIIQQRSAIARGLKFLDDRRKMNGFGDELQITFRPRYQGDITQNPRSA